MIAIRFQLPIAAFVTAILASSARADMGFSSPPIEIQVRFDNLSDYPDYDFYLKYGLGNGAPSSSLHLTKVTSGTLTRLEGTGRRLTDVYLLAVPRGQVVPPPPYDLKWLKEVPMNGIQSDPLMWRELEKLDNHNNGSAYYRVSIKDNNLTATWVGGDEPTSQGLQWCVVACSGIVLSGLIAVGGLIWFLLRSRRSKTAATRSTDDSHDD